MLHAPAYRQENIGALRQDWPRVPLPSDTAALTDSATLGRQLAALLDPEKSIEGVTAGDIRAELRRVAVLTVTAGSPDFDVKMNWGYYNQDGAVMPGSGKVTPHPLAPSPSQAGRGGSLVETEKGLPDDKGGLFDIWLNDTTYWANIPSEVWEYTLGGYQVLKKWLSYRESKVLGRSLRAEEAREFMHIARRITALLALGEALDANYRRAQA